jgi:hypothetical protein
MANGTPNDLNEVVFQEPIQQIIIVVVEKPFVQGHTVFS